MWTTLSSLVLAALLLLLLISRAVDVEAWTTTSSLVSSGPVISSRRRKCSSLREPASTALLLHGDAVDDDSSSSPGSRFHPQNMKDASITRAKARTTRKSGGKQRKVAAASRGARRRAGTLSSPLALDLEELTRVMKGRGRALMLWEWLRQGKDPLDEMWQINSSSSSSNKETTTMGFKAMKLYAQHFGRLQDTVARIVRATVSADGTTKLLLELQNGGNNNNNNKEAMTATTRHHHQVETVIIPWSDRQRSTLCVSSQVGCRQACTFCLTGRMGLLRSLSADEILVQVWAAQRYISTRQQQQRRRGDATTTLFPIDNIVYMGMGEPADNVKAVVQSAHVLIHPNQFQLAPKRVTISTVAPTPQAFADLAQANVVLAWSVHAARDDLRRRVLVPTTQYKMTELRDALIETLTQRSRRLRAVMLEVTLIDGVNDSEEDAHDLAEFCQPLLDGVPGIKLVVNLIPWNDITTTASSSSSLDRSAAPTAGMAASFSQPSRERVLAFQRLLTEYKGILCYIRTTRGDDESSACGQLATNKRPVQQNEKKNENHGNDDEASTTDNATSDD